ncbi:kinase-like domain-containing protein, partial [Clohesyomyces aquaticus]
MSLLPDAAPLQGVEEAMRGWFSDPTPIANRRPFDESQLRGISNVLRSIGQEPWSRIPRIYVVLRTINQLPLIDDFITQGLNDVWFPFTHHTLPLSLKSQSARSSFIQAQRLVLTKSLDLEKRDGKHRHFSDPNDIPVVKLAELGRGGFGIVEKVLSTISREEYARKLILRGPTFRKNKEILREFEAELAILKRLSHAHIVELVGSYTDPRYVGLLMSPVADCNLKEYLDMPVSVDRRSLLRTSFGCLVAAVCYLHQSQIRHKDIKPQAIKDHRVLITDFGISRDWADLGQSTTTGPTVKTPKYCAPEVAAYLPRNSSSDIWSLGCVFLEIWTVLCGRTTEDLNSHLKANGSTSTCYHSNIESVHSWCDSLVNESSDHDIKRPETWISMMLQIEQHKRCNAQGLFNDIVEYSKEPETQLSFVGLCCTEYEDSAESVQSSVY